MSTLLKIEFVVNERRLGPLSVPRSTPFTLQTLSELLLDREAQLQGCRLSFSWTDERDDEVLIESDADLREAIQAQTNTGGLNTNKNTLRFLVTAERESPAASRSAAGSGKIAKEQAVEKRSSSAAAAAAAQEETKPLSELTPEEVLCVFKKLHIPFACHALVREIPIGGGVLACVESIEDLRDCGLTQDKLSNVHARMLVARLLEMREKGVPARFLLGKSEAAVKLAPSSSVSKSSADDDVIPGAVAVAVRVDKIPNKKTPSQKAFNKKAKVSNTPNAALQEKPSEGRDALSTPSNKVNRDVNTSSFTNGGPVQFTNSAEQRKGTFQIRKATSSPPILNSSEVEQSKSADGKLSRSNSNTTQQSMAKESPSTDSPSIAAVQGSQKKEERSRRSVASLDHEECISLLEHLQITNARSSLRADITGKELSAVKSTADVERLGIAIGGAAFFLRKDILKYVESGVEESILDAQRLVFIKERAKQQDVSPLLVALEDKNKDIFILLITRESESVNTALKPDGRTAVHLVIALGVSDSDRAWCEECLTALLERRANVDAKTTDQSTPLHVAVRYGHTEAASLLLTHRANTEQQDMNKCTPLHIAAYKGNTEIVSLLLTHRANTEAMSGYQYTPLHIAAEKGHTETVSLLLAHRANIEAKENFQCTPLHIAALQGRTETVSLLLAHKANIEAEDRSQYTPLHIAVLNKNTETVSLLLTHKANIEVIDEYGDTPLHWAAHGGHTETAFLLITHKANIGAKNAFQDTPWRDARANGHTQIMSLLLAHEANTEPKHMFEENLFFDEQRLLAYIKERARQRDISPLLVAFEDKNKEMFLRLARECTAPNAALTPDKQKAVHLAFELGSDKSDGAWCEECIMVLLERRANVDAKTTPGATVLHVAASKGHLQVVEFMLGAKANPMELDSDQWTPLHCAADNGHTKLVPLLFIHKANINAMNKNQCTPLHYAAGNGHTETVSILLRHKANIEAKDKWNNRTPLHCAACYGHKETVSLLLAHRANIEAVDEEDYSPLQSAARNGHTKTVSLLLAHKANIEATTWNDFTPLLIAADNGHIETVSLLLTHRANIEAKENKQRAPLHIAAFKGHKETVSLLLTHRANAEAVAGVQYM